MEIYEDDMTNVINILNERILLIASCIFVT